MQKKYINLFLGEFKKELSFYFKNLKIEFENGSIYLIDKKRNNKIFLMNLKNKLNLNNSSYRFFLINDLLESIFKDFEFNY